MRSSRCLLLGLVLISLGACGMPAEEQEANAIVACNIMKEQSKPDTAAMIRSVNEVRKENGAPSFLGSGAVITEALSLGLCKQLILLPNDQYESEKLRSLEIRAKAKALQAQQAMEIRAAELIDNGKTLKDFWDLEASQLCDITAEAPERAFAMLTRQAPFFRKRIEETVDAYITLVKNDAALSADAQQRVLTAFDQTIGARTWLTEQPWENDEKFAARAFVSGRCSAWLYRQPTLKAMLEAEKLTPKIDAAVPG